MSPHHPQSFPCLVQCDSLHPISEEGPRPPATAPESGRPTSRLLTSSLHVLVTCAATTPFRAPITTHRLTPSASLQVPAIQVRRTKVTSCRHGAFLPVCEQHFLSSPDTDRAKFWALWAACCTMAPERPATLSPLRALSSWWPPSQTAASMSGLILPRSPPRTPSNII